MKTCTINTCSEKHVAKGYCRLHYERFNYGTPLNQPVRQRKIAPPNGLCTLDDCTKKHKAHGLCNMHYGIALENGSIGDLPPCQMIGCDKRANTFCRNHRSLTFLKENPSVAAAKRAKRRAQQLKATPKWLTPEHWEQINKMYSERPEGYHVDHIIPLLGKNVRGLHVPWNLQYLPAEDNLRKTNRHE